MIKSTVAGALDHELQVPLSDISRIEYEDGGLVFYGKNGKRMSILNSNRDGRRSRFDESAARGFIAAFKAKTTRV